MGTAVPKPLLRGAAPEPRKGFHPLTLLRFALVFVACQPFTERISSSVSSRTRPLMPQRMPIIAMHESSEEPP